MLVDQGDLSYADYQEALAKSEQFSVSVIQYLSKRGTITNEQLDRAQSRLHEEMILEIFLWKNVGFELDEETWPTENSERRFFVLDLMVMEAARRQDEWLRVVEVIGTNDVWIEIGNGLESVGEPISAIERIVLDRCDGIHGSKEIMARTGLPRYHVDLALFRLSNENLIRRMDLDDLIETGDKLVKVGRNKDGIRLFRSAVRHDRESIALHKRLAQAFLNEGRVAKAAAHYKFCAMTLVKNGLLREALAIYQYVLSILPTDFKALEQSLKILAEVDETLSTDDEQSLEQGLKLCKFYVDAKKYAPAERVLGYLIRVAPDDNGLFYILANLYTKTGRINEAVETYVKVAGRLHAVGDLAGAVNAYKVVVSYDTASKDICLRKMAELHARMNRAKKRRTAGIVFLMTVVVFTAAGIGYLFYHNRANADLEKILSSEENVVSEDGWRGLEQRYSDFKARYPLTEAASTAVERMRRVRFKVTEIQRAQRATRERERARQLGFLQLAENHVAKAKAMVRARDLIGALVAYEASWKAAKDGDQEIWAKQEQQGIPARIAELKEHLAQEGQGSCQIGIICQSGRLGTGFSSGAFHDWRR